VFESIAARRFAMGIAIMTTDRFLLTISAAWTALVTGVLMYIALLH
jgi:hypothetical protein